MQRVGQVRSIGEMRRIGDQMRRGGMRARRVVHDARLQGHEPGQGLTPAFARRCRLRATQFHGRPLISPQKRVLLGT